MATLFHADHPRRLIPDTSSILHSKGWFFCAGGSLTIRQGENLYMAPANFAPERLDPNELFVMKSDGSFSQMPTDKKLTVTSCAPVFKVIYKDRQAGAIMHSRSTKVLIAAQIFTGSEYKVKDQAMIKGIFNCALKRQHKFSDELVVPIVNECLDEDELAENIRNSLKNHPATSAIIVRGRGIYVWANNVKNCLRMSECYHHLLEFSTEMEKFGLNEYTHLSTAEQVVTGACVEATTPIKKEELEQQKVKSEPSTEDLQKPSTSTEKKVVEVEKKKSPAKKTTPGVKAGKVVKRTPVRGGRGHGRGGHGRGGGPMPLMATPPWNNGWQQNPMMQMNPMFGMQPPRGRGGARGNVRGRGRGRGIKRGGATNNPQQANKNAPNKGGNNKKRIAQNVIMNY